VTDGSKRAASRTRSPFLSRDRKVSPDHVPIDGGVLVISGAGTLDATCPLSSRCHFFFVSLDGVLRSRSDETFRFGAIDSLTIPELSEV